MKIKNYFLGVLLFIVFIVPINVHATSCSDCVNIKDEMGRKQCESTCTVDEKTKCLENCKEKANGNATAYTECSKSCPQEDAKNETLPGVEYNKKDLDPDSPIQFCAKTAIIWQIVGWVLLIFKIVIPIILIIFGVLDMFKSVIASKDDEIKKSAKSLAMRALSAVIIFFIPTLVSLIMGLIVNFRDSGAKADFEVCQKCILDPNDCDTSKDAGKQ